MMSRIVSTIGVIALPCTLSACSGSAPQPRTEDARPSATDIAKADADMGSVPTKTEPSKSLTAGEVASICKAGIAELFGHSPKIMKAAPQGGGIVRISYKRPYDGKLFRNDCQVQGNRIMWRGFDIRPGSGPGRWRNDPADEVLTFTVAGRSVKLLTTYSDGSTATATQPLL